MIIHLVPIGDLIEHDVPGGIPWEKVPDTPWFLIEALSGKCACECRPEFQTVWHEGKFYGVVVAHTAMDGRE